MATIDDFKKIELVTARVLAAERVPESEKLIKLTLDDGSPDSRHIVAGIGKAYEPDALVGKTIIIVANLEPRSLMGVESRGMLLAANGELPVLLTPEGEVPPGTMIR